MYVSNINSRRMTLLLDCVENLRSQNITYFTANKSDAEQVFKWVCDLPKVTKVSKSAVAWKGKTLTVRPLTLYAMTCPVSCEDYYVLDPAIPNRLLTKSKWHYAMPEHNKDLPPFRSRSKWRAVVWLFTLCYGIALAHILITAGREIWFGYKNYVSAWDSLGVGAAVLSIIVVMNVNIYMKFWGTR